MPTSLAFSATTTPPIAGHHITYADSAASRHFFTERGDFVTYGPVPDDIATGSVANGGAFRVEGMGRIRKMVSYRVREVKITLDNVLHAPHLDHNLISIGCLDLKGCTITFGGGTAIFYEPSGAPFMCGTRYNQTMYQVEFMPEATAMMERDDTITTATMERDDTKTAISTGSSTKPASAETDTENITETKTNK
ncbi:hypothetical protein C0991_004079 [Blastosporella zonata]|nr:hypothetical protein C0991_004079 [Blastosporella zonata]